MERGQQKRMANLAKDRPRVTIAACAACWNKNRLTGCLGIGDPQPGSRGTTVSPGGHVVRDLVT